MGFFVQTPDSTRKIVSRLRPSVYELYSQFVIENLVVRVNQISQSRTDAGQHSREALKVFRIGIAGIPAIALCAAPSTSTKAPSAATANGRWRILNFRFVRHRFPSAVE